MKGQTLIELLIALSIVVIILSVTTTTIISSLNNAHYNKNKNLATKYSQEGMEIVRRIRNSNYGAFTNYSGNYCLDKGKVSLGAAQSVCENPNVDIFIRSVQIEQSPGCGTNTAKVTVTAAWKDGKCQSGNLYCNKVLLISCLSTVNPIQAP